MKTIYLIEDDSSIIDVYTVGLKAGGFEVVSLMTGKEAIEKLKTEKPDLILLDLLLPDINGIDVLKEIRKNEKTKDVPVFILTNYSDSELEKLGYNLQAEQHLLKADYTPSLLLEAVKKRLKQ